METYIYKSVLFPVFGPFIPLCAAQPQLVPGQHVSIRDHRSGAPRFSPGRIMEPVGNRMYRVLCNVGSIHTRNINQLIPGPPPRPGPRRQQTEDDTHIPLWDDEDSVADPASAGADPPVHQDGHPRPRPPPQAADTAPAEQQAEPHVEPPAVPPAAPPAVPRPTSGLRPRPSARGERHALPRG